MAPFIPSDDAHLDPGGEEIRVLTVHALLVALVVVSVVVLAALHDLNTAVVSSILMSALTFGGVRSSQVSGRRRTEDERG